jgi:hypothetical protein
MAEPGGRDDPHRRPGRRAPRRPAGPRSVPPVRAAPRGGPDPGEGASDAEERQGQGLSPRHHRVAELLTKTASTARSFLFYDARNETIHRFLADLIESFLTTLAAEERIALRVEPFQILFEGQPVYLNRDRERSLAFRLYRDGVRSLTFRKGFDWEELSRLLAALSIRYTGVQQREDDVVTLLWQAQFEHLDIQAVEGIVPEDDAAGEGPSPAAGRLLGLPDDVDLPRPALPPPTGPSWAALTAEALDGLRAEARTEFVSEDCLQLLGRLRAVLRSEESPLAFAQVAHLFTEIRDFLIWEEDLGPLKGFLGLLWEMASEDAPAWDPDRGEQVYELLGSCGDRAAVCRLLHSLPTEERRLRPDLIDVLDRACPDPLAAVADALAEERGPAARAAARQLLEHYGRRRLEFLQDRFAQASGEIASDLLRAIAGIGGEAATAFISRQSSHSDPAVQDEALWHLERTAYSGSVGRALFDAFCWTDSSRRARVLRAIARSNDRRFVDQLVSFLEERGTSLRTEEAAAVGSVLGRLGGEEVVGRFAVWLTPSGLFRKEIQSPLVLQVAAAMALAEIPGSTAETALQAAAGVAGPEAQRWIEAAAVQRRRSPPRRSGP